MTNPFAKLNNDGLEKAKDQLGGGGFLFDSDIYLATILEMYAGQSAGGAHNVTLVLEMPDGRKMTETVYVTNKNGENWFLNKQDNTKRVPLPGFVIADHISLIAAGVPLCELAASVKTIKVRNWESKQDEMKDVQMFMPVIGKQIKVGVLLELHNKNTKVGNEYVPTADTRKTNVIDKVFHPTMNLTVVEAQNGIDAPAFHDGWLERNKGKEVDRRTLKDGQAGAVGAPGRPAPVAAGGNAPAGGGAPARPKLFG